MSMFWIIGIIANIALFVLAMVWIAHEIKKHRPSRPPRNPDTNP